MWEDFDDSTPVVSLPDAEITDDLITEESYEQYGLPDSYSPLKKCVHKRKPTANGEKRVRKHAKPTPDVATDDDPPPPSPNDEDFFDTSSGAFDQNCDSGSADFTSDGELSSDADLASRDLDFDASAGPERQYDDFVEGVTMGSVGLYQISESFFVCEGWNGYDSTGRWFHLQVVDAASKYFACTCSTSTQRCVHRRYMAEDGFKAFSSSPHKLRHADCKIALFSCELTPKGETISLFSVANQTKPTQLKYRAIVKYIGLSPDRGTWTCTKDSGGACPHAVTAKKYLLEVVGSSEDEAAPENSATDLPLSLVGSTLLARSVSHLGVMPPIWAALSTDPTLYLRSCIDTPPPMIPLGENPRCRCGAGVDHGRPITQLKCIVYTVSRAVHASIEVQMCNKCSVGRHTYVGPDCRELGLFNYNNRTLFSHAIFDDYNTAFTALETPFASQTSVMSRRYETMGSDRFVSANVFRAAWFLFADLLVLGGDMACPDCGDAPDETIWDGVTLAFGRTKLSSSLCPPTALLDNHPVHEEVHPVKSQTMLSDADLRKSVRKILSTPFKCEKFNPTFVEGIDDEEERQAVKEAEIKLLNQAMERTRITPDVCARLKSLNSGLGRLFETYFGLGAVRVGVSPPEVYVNLFKQIAAEESVLQMITLPVLVSLNEYRAHPTPANHIKLLHLPAVYNIIEFHKGDPRVPTNNILSLLDFLSSRTLDVTTRLLEGRSALEVPDPELQMDPWDKSRAYYSMAPVRLRPAYPGLKHDQGSEGGKRGATCNKFYNQYGKQRLTGGIMCVWCTHSICYGFHCIPQAEGRNDVFSAIITCWVKAPSLVIYDFACALAAYCVSREPYFFANTHFLIDDFHAFGHTKCSHAAFLKTYAEVDPDLARINTSAAECGNGGLSRIRKGTRAIVYTRVFISIWNRVIIKKRLAEKAKARSAMA
ncbi:hypothetical protein C8R43DRAFT_871030 [Mycena crocata]|nr:hypothetical protein C8R43DRAFT_871030 [Mycena crocata]